METKVTKFRTEAIQRDLILSELARIRNEPGIVFANIKSCDGRMYIYGQKVEV